ncbi:hypothetical protein [Oceaniglobus indicus]|uniref:hypothetical protein n=1 Tax=Oceaniglobus indicus TaxID=2047749 RepID=UPI000C1A5A6A|nr:hypothetical protein [Oceaniglobus indicus]
MTIHRKIETGAAVAPDGDLQQVRRFLADHGTDLARKAHTLGGAAVSARVFLLIEAVREARRLTRAQRRQLIALHRLLTLQDVGDPDRIETARFAEIDPDSPFVIACCRLSDRLAALLADIATDDAPDGCACGTLTLETAA